MSIHFLKVKIIKAQKKDATSLLDIQKEAFSPLYDWYIDEQSPYLHTIDMMIDRINRVDSDYYKILANGLLCGGLCVYKLENDFLWLAIVYIKPEYQNKKIAQTAISLAEGKYPAAKKWGLDFPIDQIKNKKCYERLGFKDSGKRNVINDKLTLAVYEKMF